MSAPPHIERLRRLLANPGASPLLTVPGCWDGLSALLIEQAGFDCAFLTGGGLSMARLGQADLGLVTASELADATALIRDRVLLPLLVDADTGFGGSLNAHRTVRALERAGASAVQIEDQVFPKRCGHMAGKSVVPLAEALARLRAALDARDHLLICARTDAAAVEGMTSALERAEAFLECGADLVFVEGPPTVADAERVARAFGRRVPLVYNLVEGGSGEVRDAEMLERLGYSIALHPLVMLHGFVRHAPTWLSRLKRDRDTPAALSGEVADLAEINTILGAADMLSLNPNSASG